MVRRQSEKRPNAGSPACQCRCGIVRNAKKEHDKMGNATPISDQMSELFQLLADASDGDSTSRLRRLKPKMDSRKEEILHRLISSHEAVYVFGRNVKATAARMQMNAAT